ncbi:hypothetical protein BD413DRAFT_496244 [Trametes elegans]|nr:hypothetical protein BD413DRAFT_496244 [Trametes elegans]
MPQTGLPGYATKVPELSAALRDKPGFLPVYRGPNPQGVSPRKPKRIRKPRVKAKAAACKAKTKSRRGANAKPPRARRLLSHAPDAACAQPSAPTVAVTLAFRAQSGGISPTIAQRPSAGITPDATSAALGAPGILASRCTQIFQPATNDSTIALGYATMEVERCPILGLSDDTAVYVDKCLSRISSVVPPLFNMPIPSPLADHESYRRALIHNLSVPHATGPSLPQSCASPPPSNAQTSGVQQKRVSQCDANCPVDRASRPGSCDWAAMEGFGRHGTVKTHGAANGRKGGVAGPDTARWGDMLLSADALACREVVGKCTSQDVYPSAYVSGGTIDYQDAYVETSADMNAGLGRLRGSFAGDDNYLARALRHLTLAQRGFELAARGGHAVEQAVPSPIISVQEPTVLAVPRCRSDAGAVAVDARVQPSPRSGQFLPSNSFPTERSVRQAGHEASAIFSPSSCSSPKASWNNDSNTVTRRRATNASSMNGATVSTYSALAGALSASGPEM